MYMYTMSPCWAEAQMPFFTRFQPLGRNWWYWAGCLRHTNVEGFLKWGYPKMDGLYWTITLRWMIWGVPPPILGNPYTTWVSTPSGEIVTSSYVVTGQSHLPDNCIIAGLGFRHL